MHFSLLILLFTSGNRTKYDSGGLSIKYSKIPSAEHMKYFHSVQVDVMESS